MLLTKNGRHFLYYLDSDFAVICVPLCIMNPQKCFASSSSTQNVSSHQDHYKTLGVSRTATAKEIKSAFFELSKKHHPDMNPEDSVIAAEKFQNVNDAYEVLGSEEKRRIYDSLTAERHSYPASLRRFHRTASGHHHSSAQNQQKEATARKPKAWTDLDIDFKDFEHFQSENRRKRTFRDWQQASTTADHFWASQQYSKQYKPAAVLEREATACGTGGTAKAR